MEKFTIFWFRRDLRINDNKGFFEALNGRNKVIPIFIYDTEIIDKLHKDDHRLTFIQNAWGGINNAMKRNRCALGTYRGTPEAVFEKIIREFPIEKVIANHDYEPYAMERDERVKKLLKAKDIDFETYKDQVIFERNEVVKDDGNPYMVYTP
jgi:deoxyribodipyrimidine photo-lyase